ncbi:MAG TPA: Rossmann-like and DUF2520 domain-containing protein, partial [Burkholderiales bacterium]|nr:Rossmann-like and DUF2520 domain-containing protein [Burkholderiales bacterium]
RRTLNLIGAGRVGGALGRLWTRAGVFEIQDVLTQSLKSARAAVRAMNAGRAVAAVDEMRAADVWLLATPDDAIGLACRALAASGKLQPDSIVFHVSGATPSAELRPAQRRGARIASAHPIKTFTGARAAARTFAGTYCAAEGDARALRVLKPAFERVGARLFDIAPEMKRVYHAGGVFACNYLAALIEAAVACHGRAGIGRTVSLRAIEPMVRETVDAIFARGPARALTGPISRGDVASVGRQLEALARWNGDMAGLYRGLGLLAVKLAAVDRRLDLRGAARLRAVLGAAGKRSSR